MIIDRKISTLMSFQIAFLSVASPYVYGSTPTIDEDLRNNIVYQQGSLQATQDALMRELTELKSNMKEGFADAKTSRADLLATVLKTIESTEKRLKTQMQENHQDNKQDHSDLNESLKELSRVLNIVKDALVEKKHEDQVTKQDLLDKISSHHRTLLEVSEKKALEISRLKEALDKSTADQTPPTYGPWYFLTAPMTYAALASVALGILNLRTHNETLTPLTLLLYGAGTALLAQVGWNMAAPQVWPAYRLLVQLGIAAAAVTGVHYTHENRSYIYPHLNWQAVGIFSLITSAVSQLANIEKWASTFTPEKKKES